MLFDDVIYKYNKNKPLKVLLNNIPTSITLFSKFNKGYSSEVLF